MSASPILMPLPCGSNFGLSVSCVGRRYRHGLAVGGYQRRSMRSSSAASGWRELHHGRGRCIGEVLEIRSACDATLRLCHSAVVRDCLSVGPLA